MSEVYVIDDYLRGVYAKHAKSCQCPLSKSNPLGCWYKFGFAFIRELGPPATAEINSGTDGEVYMSIDQCALNQSDSTFSSDPELMNSDEALRYVENYAKVVRERWAIGDCGEDILLLVVQNPPDALRSKPSSSSKGSSTSPMIFLSYGSHVTERLGVLDNLAFNAQEPLRNLVDAENANLRKGYPLSKVLNRVVMRTVESLKRVENVLKPLQPRSHIPLWAWGAFATCGITCAIMGIGLCMARSSNRRGLQRKTTSNDPAMRRWKSGFAGEDPQPTTYVNLVQMMMPHPKPAPSNMPQQV